MNVFIIVHLIVLLMTRINGKPSTKQDVNLKPIEIEVNIEDDDSTPPRLPIPTQLTDFQKQLNSTFSKALGDMVQNFQRLNMTTLAKDLMRNEPKLTFEGISRLEIPLGNNFDGLNKITDKIPGLNLLKP